MTLPKVLLIIIMGIMFTLIPMVHASTEILNIETSIVDDVMFIKTSIENTEQQKVLISIYVESDDQVPLGVMFFKTTLIEGNIPMEYGFTLQDNHTPGNVYINIFTDNIENGGILINLKELEL